MNADELLDAISGLLLFAHAWRNHCLRVEGPGEADDVRKAAIERGEAAIRALIARGGAASPPSEIGEVVAATERAVIERCAKVCEKLAAEADRAGGYPRNGFEEVPQDGMDACAAAIRKLKG